MSPDDCRTLLDNYRDGMMGKKSLDDSVDPDIVLHRSSGDTTGIDALKGYATTLQAAFPDQKVVFEDTVVEGDKIAARILIDTGPHTGVECYGLSEQTKGKSARFGEIVIFRVKDGRIAEHWTQADMIGMMQQFGLMPS